MILLYTLPYNYIFQQVVILLYMNDIAMYIIDSNIQLPISFSLSPPGRARSELWDVHSTSSVVALWCKIFCFVGASLYGFNSNFCYKWYL